LPAVCECRVVLRGEIIASGGWSQTPAGRKGILGTVRQIAADVVFEGWELAVWLDLEVDARQEE
jgi:hypothetical protein